MLHGFLLATLAAIGPPQEEVPSLEEVRWHVRPSLVVIAKRILVYSKDQDYRRAKLAADTLQVFRKGLNGHDDIVYLDPLGDALKKEDLAATELGVRMLVRTDLHFLLLHLTNESIGTGVSPRTRLLMAKQDLEFLSLWISKGKDGDQARRLFPLIYDQLAAEIPGKSSYSASSLGWQKEASRIAEKLEQALDAVFPELKIPPPPSKAEGRVEPESEESP